MSLTEHKPTVVAVASGKGGVGKSFLAANLGASLAGMGKEAIVIDAALGNASLHTHLGVSEPQYTFSEYLLERDCRLADIVVSTPIPGLDLVAGCRDPLWADTLRRHQLNRLKDDISVLDVDYVIVDLNRGFDATVTALWNLAEHQLVVTTPEPAPIELTYRALKAAFSGRLRVQGLGEFASVASHEAARLAGGVPAPAELVERANTEGIGTAEDRRRLRASLEQFRPQLVLNCCRSRADIDLGHAVCSAASRVFATSVGLWGCVDYDDAVWVSARRRRPLLVEHPEARAAKNIERMARELVRGTISSVYKADDSTFYDLLAIESRASDEEIRRAIRAVRQVYAWDSTVVSGLYRRDELEKLHAQLDEAYATLADPVRRAAYDLSIESKPTRVTGAPMAIADTAETIRRRVAESPSVTEPDEVAELREYSGSALQALREARGIDLREVADVTKVGIGHLRAIEEEKYGRLPAPVYVRGFLIEYARILGINPGAVVDSYLARLRAQSTG